MDLLGSLLGPSTSGISAMVFIFFGCSFLLCFVVIATQSWHGFLTYDHIDGIQKSHRSPTPRVGGLPIFITLLLGSFIPVDQISSILGAAVLASLPAFAVGFAEDLTRRVAPITRLLACMASGALASLITGFGVHAVSISAIDLLLTYSPLMVLITAFSVSGICNSINLIDGFHGVASGISVLALAGTAYIAIQVGDLSLAQSVVIFLAATLGFLFWNYPLGKIFLGDGGAYLIGFFLSWFLILLVNRNPTVNPWAAVLICAMPITEVLVSMLRRVTKRRSPATPDRLHLHHLVQAYMHLKLPSWWSDEQKKLTVAPVIWMISVCPVFISTYTYPSHKGCMVAFALFVLFYGILYRRLYRLAYDSLR